MIIAPRIPMLPANRRTLHLIHSTGQSGNVLSTLYRNFEEPWRTGGYITIPTRRDAFEAGALGRLRLVPR